MQGQTHKGSSCLAKSKVHQTAVVNANGGEPTLGSSTQPSLSNAVHSRTFSEDSRGLYEDLRSYQDVLKQMKPLIVANNGHLDTEHRQTLASAYKHILNGLRRHLKAAASQLTTVESSKLSAVVSEISRVCNEIIDLLRQWLIPAAAVGEESVFYWKLFADFYRYLFDTTGSEDHASTSFQAYKLAWLHASQHLDATHHTRLGLALNFSIFYDDVLKSPERACHLAKFAFDEAVAYATENSVQVCDESFGVMQLLQDNITFWLDKAR